MFWYCVLNVSVQICTLEFKDIKFFKVDFKNGSHAMILCVWGGRGRAKLKPKAEEGSEGPD